MSPNLVMAKVLKPCGAGLRKPFVPRGLVGSNPTMSDYIYKLINKYFGSIFIIVNLLDYYGNLH